MFEGLVWLTLKFALAVVPLTVAENETEIAASTEPALVFKLMFGLTLTTAPLLGKVTLPK